MAIGRGRWRELNRCSRIDAPGDQAAEQHQQQEQHGGDQQHRQRDQPTRRAPCRPGPAGRSTRSGQSVTVEQQDDRRRRRRARSTPCGGRLADGSRPPRWRMRWPMWPASVPRAYPMAVQSAVDRRLHHPRPREQRGVERLPEEHRRSRHRRRSADRRTSASAANRVGGGRPAHRPRSARPSPAQRWRRARAISKQARVPAVPTLRLATRPRIGIDTSSSQRSRTRRRQARALGAQHQGDGRVVHGRGPRGSSRPARRGRPPRCPASFIVLMAVGMPPTVVIGRCSIGAGRRLGDRGVMWTARCCGQHDAGDAGALGRAQQGAEVARVGDAVAAAAGTAAACRSGGR